MNCKSSGTQSKKAGVPILMRFFEGIAKKKRVSRADAESRAHAVSKWSWRERQAVTTTAPTSGGKVGEVIHLVRGR